MLSGTSELESIEGKGIAEMVDINVAEAGTVTSDELRAFSAA